MSENSEFSSNFNLEFKEVMSRNDEINAAIIEMKTKLHELSANPDKISGVHLENDYTIKEKLKAENDLLIKEINELKCSLDKIKISNGTVPVPVPWQKETLMDKNDSKIVNASGDSPIVLQQPKINKKSSQPLQQTANTKKMVTEVTDKIETKDSKKKVEKKVVDNSKNSEIDISRLNMKVGKIVQVEKHPDADSLYVEKVDVGEPVLRTVVSGLVKHIPIEKMQDRIAVFLCNLKPAKMRGVLSEAMIMCASTPEKVEIIELPNGLEIGDRITVDGYTGEPDVLLNPKKKIWETIQPDLKINSDGIATYRNIPWNANNKGHCKVPSMKDCIIK